MALGASAILTALLDHAHATGMFNVVRAAEFKSSPPSGLCFALWAQSLGPAPTGSGLASTTALMHCTAQIHYPAFATPEEDVDLKVVGAADAYMGRLHGDFTLGGLARNADLLGEMGEPMEWTFGYLNVDNKVSRIAVLQIYIVINDLWTQAP